MSKSDWEDLAAELLKKLQEAARVAGESQAEAAVYREMLEDWHEVAGKAEAQKDFSLLHQINDRLVPFYLPTKKEGKLWGEHFLHAYMRDASWLEHAKQALEEIKADAEKLSDDNEEAAELKKRIIAAAEQGLITHV